MKPVSFSRTISATPPTSVDITGKLEAWASIRLTGVPSFFEVQHIKSLAEAKIRIIFSCLGVLNEGDKIEA